ncbi:phosphotransferase [Kaistia geumhonensis]|uniref:Ser/Thr protein kinase RdoA (MazF antagonist) n=1 Tax=Kaistia geumhonensis TaxID=410839 RepID=A0ABU0MCC1_9HYPH|nr:phosphotransferase [Kaistia geumhonensis]MCX5481538.1 phosphotransferase [Kaistia geumhonensis]MDQ0518603.1 Ser/Thr protein kinase RdoA (MazF antagonist) [Kaistia geumhonensis]
MIELERGRAGQILLRGDAVVRPAGAWTPTVHRFLSHLRDRGFAAAPVPLAIEGDQEVVSYVAGRVSEDLADPLTGSPAMLISAARLLRRFHDASRGFLESDGAAQHWMLPAQEPRELVCHGDFAPYNVVTEGEAAVGLIDFDAAHPAPAAWDIAYALYRWAPLTDPAQAGAVHDSEEQLRRARLFCDAYGADEAGRWQLPHMIGRRVRALVDFMLARAEAGDVSFAEAVARGDSDIYIRDLDYLARIGERLRLALI